MLSISPRSQVYAGLSITTALSFIYGDEGRKEEGEIYSIAIKCSHYIFSLFDRHKTHQIVIIAFIQQSFASTSAGISPDGLDQMIVSPLKIVCWIPTAMWWYQEVELLGSS